MLTIDTNEQIFYDKNGKPISVLPNYKVYNGLIELIEDVKCIKIIQKREKESTYNATDLKTKHNVV